MCFPPGELGVGWAAQEFTEVTARAWQLDQRWLTKISRQECRTLIARFADAAQLDVNLCRLADAEQQTFDKNERNGFLVKFVVDAGLSDEFYKRLFDTSYNPKGPVKGILRGKQ